MAKIDVKVPDIGDFNDVPVIEVLVKPGDVVKAEQSLITLESDKASMDVPSPVEGTVAEVVAKVGDKVSMGTLIARVESCRGGGEGRGSSRQDRHIFRFRWENGSARRSEKTAAAPASSKSAKSAPLAKSRGACKGRDDRHHNS